MRLPVGPDAPTRARNIVRDAVSSSELSAIATLLTSEVVTNAVRHSGLTPGETIGFSVDVEDGTVRVGVSDDGPGFDKPTHPVAGEDHGFGLAMVDRLADRWGVTHDGSNEVWFEIDALAPDLPKEMPGRDPS
jgi:serine/threonine-protein kinase RsbW